MRGVVLTGPQQLDWFADRFGDLRGLNLKVQFKFATVSAAKERGVNKHFLRWHADCCRDAILRALLKLDRAGNVAIPVNDFGRAVHRLKGGMREEGQLLLGLDLPDCFVDIGNAGALLTHHGTGVNGCGAQLRFDFLVVERCVRAVVPFDL